MSVRIAVCLAALLGSQAVLVHAQSAPAAAPGTAQTEAPYTLSTAVQLVVTDVSVTDSHGNPVHGLKQSDFTLTEDGKPETIRSFDAEQPAQAALPKEATNLPTGVFSNGALKQLPATTNILLIDPFNTDVNDQMYLRIQLMRTLESLGGRSAIAVFAINSGHASVLLQNFTSDPGLLKAAISRELPRLTANGGNRLEHFQDALGALRTISTYLSRIPGHKNLLWFSSYFPFTEQAEGFINASNELQKDELVHIYNQLSLDRVSVYPIDVRGVDTTAAPAVNQEDAMEKIAKATGGTAYYNRSDVGKVASNTILSGSDYYTLTYAPKDYVADNKFHKVAVSVAGGAYTLHYRSGYVAFDLKNDAERGLNEQRLASIQADVGQLESGGRLQKHKDTKSDIDSLTNYNKPPPESIVFEARILPAAEVPGWQVLPPARNAQGKLIGNAKDAPYVIEYAAVSNDLRFVPAPSGKQHAELIAAAMAYTDNGDVVGTAIDHVDLNFTDAQMDIANRKGTPLRQQIRLPKGNLYVALSLIDSITGRTGTLDIPVSAAQAKP